MTEDEKKPITTEARKHLEQLNKRLVGYDKEYAKLQGAVIVFDGMKEYMNASLAPSISKIVSEIYRSIGNLNKQDGALFEIWVNVLSKLEDKLNAIEETNEQRDRTLKTIVQRLELLEAESTEQAKQRHIRGL